MYLDENGLAIIMFSVMLMVLLAPNSLRDALGISVWRLTRTIDVIRPKLDCRCCEGEGSYMHPLGVRVDCILGCNEPQRQQVLHWRVRSYVEKLARRMGMDEKKAREFSLKFVELANSYLGPPIPMFVRGEHGWEYKHGDEKAA